MFLTKREIESLVANYLKNYPQTEIGYVRQFIETVLAERGIVDSKETDGGSYSITREITLSDRNALLINEVIYDFLYSRIISPGINKKNLDLPYIHVSNKEKLLSYL